VSDIINLDEIHVTSCVCDLCNPDRKHDDM